jgi:hypothetical protein
LQKILKMKNKTYLVQPILDEAQNSNPTILRILLNEQFTRIDFGYAAPWIYVKGGWIDIAPNTFIRIVYTNEKFKLVNTQNIPISPDRHDFESKSDWKVFSLFFEPLPLKDCVIEIIEEENPNANNFNYYEISFKDVKQCEIENEKYLI